jgi:hypothetical protein
MRDMYRMTSRLCLVIVVLVLGIVTRTTYVRFIDFICVCLSCVYGGGCTRFLSLRIS